jgi:hypothetical protein
MGNFLLRVAALGLGARRLINIWPNLRRFFGSLVDRIKFTFALTFGDDYHLPGARSGVRIKSVFKAII